DYMVLKDAVIFAIDISKSMLKPPPPSNSKKADTDSPAAAALKCAYQIMQQRIISNPKDMMGVLLFNTEKEKFLDEEVASRGSLGYPHCYLLNDLEIPSAEDVKKLKSIVEGDEEMADILVPSEEPVAMNNLLFCANQIFTTKAPNFGSRRLFIITDEDNPALKKEAKESATVRAKDLYDLGVIIELFPISHPGSNFDRTKFYDDIIYRDPNESDEALVAPVVLNSSGSDGISLLASLISDINSKQVPKRTLFSNMPFEIGPKFSISVKGYNILQRQQKAKSCYVWLGGEKAQIAEGETTKFTDQEVQGNETPREGGNKISEADLKASVKKAYKFGGELVSFDVSEQKGLKDFGAPILRLIGFKPQSMLPFWASVKKSTFIYPSEEDFIGSTRVFSALWQKLQKDELMGLGWCITRKNSGPSLVAILPSAERLDEVTKGQVFPAGLWLYPLPYADDIRSPPEQPNPVRAPDNLIDSMRKVVQQLQLPKAIYDPSRYPNPALQWHYKILQAMALDEVLPEVPEDMTVPKYRQIHKRAGQLIYEWGVILHDEATAYNEARRRGLKHEVDDDQEKPKKKPRATASAASLADMSTTDLKKLAVDGRLEKYTMPQLKELCSAKGLSTSGKKADLVLRVEQWVEESY
ncbi:ATP-dependent DNA helicase II subunit 1, partial [Hyphodiscus hymeniophilus]